MIHILCAMDLHNCANTSIAEKAHLSRETFYRTLSSRGNPTIKTLRPARRKRSRPLSPQSRRACRHHRHKHPRQRRIHRVGGVQQGVMAQMGVTLRRLDLGMPQKALHLVQAASRVDQEAGVRMREERSLASAKLAML